MPNSYVIPVTEAGPNERMAFLTIVNFVLRNIVGIVITGLVFAVLLAIPSYSVAPSYTASTSFIVEGEPLVGRSLGLGGGTGRGPDFYVALMQTPLILEPLVEARFEVDPGRPPQSLVERYGSGSSLQERKDAAMERVAGMIKTKISEIGVIELSVTAENPRLAAAIAQGVMEQIEIFNFNQRKLRTSAERRFIEQRLVEVGDEVRAAEDRMLAFMVRNRQASTPALAMEQGRLSDNMSQKRSLYSSILQALEKAKIDEVRENPQATVVSRAVPPLSPNSRHVLRNGVLGFFVGALFATLFAFVREFFARIPDQSTPEAAEYMSLRTKASQRLRRSLGLLSGLRRNGKAAV
jgi:hypothetical protein